MQQISFFETLDKLYARHNKIQLSELFDAYFSCRRNKRRTINALCFEAEYEQNLIQLCDEINSGSYQPGKSIAFIVNKPVQREIFAADFRDRVVHHLVYHKLNPLFEKEFIYDSYACRMNKGAHLGIQRLDRFIRQFSQNYTKDCYVLKLDINGFFMSINKNILFTKLSAFVKEKYTGGDQSLLLALCKIIIFNDPTHHCTIKGQRSNWQGLPDDKSLFHALPDTGLPIGNLTSQVLANFYMNSFDHFIKHHLRIRFYGRYVDDFVLVHTDKQYLASLIPIITQFLSDNLQLTLHPKKIYLQHYAKGVKFLGVIIKPHRIYITNRIKGNFYTAIAKHNEIVTARVPTKSEKESFLSSMNSYLGLMKHCDSYRVRKKMLLRYLSHWWWRRYHSSETYLKLTTKRQGVVAMLNRAELTDGVNRYFSGQMLERMLKIHEYRMGICA